MEQDVDIAHSQPTAPPRRRAPPSVSEGAQLHRLVMRNVITRRAAILAESADIFAIWELLRLHRYFGRIGAPTVAEVL